MRSDVSAGGLRRVLLRLGLLAVVFVLALETTPIGTSTLVRALAGLAWLVIGYPMFRDLYRRAGAGRSTFVGMMAPKPGPVGDEPRGLAHIEAAVTASTVRLADAQVRLKPLLQSISRPAAPVAGARRTTGELERFLTSHRGSGDTAGLDLDRLEAIVDELERQQ